LDDPETVFPRNLPAGSWLEIVPGLWQPQFRAEHVRRSLDQRSLETWPIADNSAIFLGIGA
jgi:hypothetical protein